MAAAHDQPDSTVRCGDGGRGEDGEATHSYASLEPCKCTSCTGNCGNATVAATVVSPKVAAAAARGA